MKHESTTQALVDLARSIQDAEGLNVRRKIILEQANAAGIDDKVIYKNFCRPECRSLQARGQYNMAAIIATLNGERIATPSQHIPSPPRPRVTIPIATPVPVSEPVGDEPVTSKQETVEPLNLASHAYVMEESSYVPDVDPFYVKWGNHTTLTQILKSEQFFPVYVSGPSGNGKTLMVEQICAKLKRKFIRINLTSETDEDDLLGGFRLQDGNTVFAKGPVIRAMEEGAVLLLDEIDRATNKIMCLQSVLEGKSVLLKKICETIIPAPGFTIIATANTNGRGDDNGRYTAASLLDEAFLERFPIIMNQKFPTEAVEMKIVLQSMTKYGCIDADFATKLVGWAKIIRKTFDDGGIDDVISTRRLDHTVKTFAILGSRATAIALVTNRFPQETGEAFIELYSKIDAEIHNELTTRAEAGPFPSQDFTIRQSSPHSRGHQSSPHL